ncbi:MAG: hypothetical protein ACRD3V_15250 [Vicinamibacteria bacterium]
MPARLTDRPRKLREAAPPVAGGLPFPRLLRVYEAMAAQDSRVVFDTTRPLADELWNLIDGKRTLDEIGVLLSLQFDLTLEPSVFLPFADQLAEAELIALGSEDG